MSGSGGVIEERSLKFFERWPTSREVEMDFRQGGVTVEPEDTIHLYGKVQVSFEPSKSISVGKFTRLTFLITRLRNDSNVGICLYADYTGKFEDNNVYCVALMRGNLALSRENVIVESAGIGLDGFNENIALSKRTDQSSLYRPGYPSLAVDGNTQQKFEHDLWEINSVTHTLAEISPWWEVDLMDASGISKIVVHKRDEQYEDNLSDFTLTIYKENGREASKLIYTGIADAVTEFMFDNIVGKRVRITLNGSHARTLCLAEVQVFGNIFRFDIPLGEVLSLPNMNVNRIAFVQEQLASNQEGSFVESIMFLDDAVEIVGVRPALCLVSNANG